MATKNQTPNEIAEAIDNLVNVLDYADLHGPNKQCGMIGVSMTEAVMTLAMNIGRIADVMEKQSKQK
jgi:hypothetical protein